MAVHPVFTDFTERLFIAWLISEELSWYVSLTHFACLNCTIVCLTDMSMFHNYIWETCISHVCTINGFSSKQLCCVRNTFTKFRNGLSWIQYIHQSVVTAVLLAIIFKWIYWHVAVLWELIVAVSLRLFEIIGRRMCNQKQSMNTVTVKIPRCLYLSWTSGGAITPL